MFLVWVTAVSLDQAQAVERPEGCVSSRHVCGGVWWPLVLPWPGWSAGLTHTAVVSRMAVTVCLGRADSELCTRPASHILLGDSGGLASEDTCPTDGHGVAQG